ncbi:MAG: hypothetical protein AB1505_27415 [Candidatus Latescibacterota bacterium]
MAALLVGCLFAAAGRAQAPDFYAHWGDGRAEVSTYAVVQPRYGEPRAGHAVLIYVTEDIHRDSFVKVESAAPASDRIYALKLNQVLKFVTGIYSYSVMTSVFSAVEGLDGSGPLALCRLSLSAQEWCGHVFDELVWEDGELQGRIDSYFEAEGRHQYELDVPDGFVSEDHLLIQVRELKGAWMEAGEEQPVRILPGLWWLRQTHRPHEILSGVLRKGEPSALTVGDSTWAVVPWSWGWDGYRKTVWVEEAYPHRLLRWEDSAGGSGVLLASQRLAYWQLHGRDDEVWRERLGIGGSTPPEP